MSPPVARPGGRESAQTRCRPPREGAPLGNPLRGAWLASSILAALEQPNPHRDDETLILGDIARKAVVQVRETVVELVRDRMPAEAETLATMLSEGRWMHDYPIRLEQAVVFGQPAGFIRGEDSAASSFGVISTGCLRLNIMECVSSLDARSRVASSVTSGIPCRRRSKRHPTFSRGGCRVSSQQPGTSRLQAGEGSWTKESASVSCARRATAAATSCARQPSWFKSYPEAPRVALPPVTSGAGAPADAGLFDVLARRRSVRAVS